MIMFTVGGCLSACQDTTPLPGKADPPGKETPQQGRSPGKADPLARRPPWQGRPPRQGRPLPVQCMLGDTVNKRVVCILLECNSFLRCNFALHKRYSRPFHTKLFKKPHHSAQRWSLFDTDKLVNQYRSYNVVMLKLDNYSGFISYSLFLQMVVVALNLDCTSRYRTGNQCSPDLSSVAYLGVAGPDRDHMFTGEVSPCSLIGSGDNYCT